MCHPTVYAETCCNCYAETHCNFYAKTRCNCSRRHCVHIILYIVLCMICLNLESFLVLRDGDSGEIKFKLVDRVRSKIRYCLQIMNSSWSQYYDIVKRVSSLSGQWPYQRGKTRLLCVCLVTLSTFSMIIPQVNPNSQ